MLNVPVTTNCCVSPFGTDAFAGDKERDTRLGAETVRVAEPLTNPDAAVIVAVPACLVTAIPGALMVAIAGCTQLQVAVWVKSR